MRTHLLYPDRDFDTGAAVVWNADALTTDLGLDAVFAAMGGGDKFLREVARRVVLTSETRPEDIAHRQAVLADLMRVPELARGLYQVAGDAIAGEKKILHGMFFKQNPNLILSRSIQVLELFLESLRKLREVAHSHHGDLSSAGLRALCREISEELTDAYLAEIEEHLATLRFDKGVVISARVGGGGKGRDHVLREPPKSARWVSRMIGGDRRPALSFRIADRDEAGAQALEELRGRGVGLVADALAQSVDHILSYFTTLRWELAFYLACLNLYDELSSKGRQVCFPTPEPPGTMHLSFVGLTDTMLGLRRDDALVGNNLDVDGKGLIVITGANQGGKSTFLRGVGTARLMMQCGLFVTARSFRASVTTGLCTHYRREEDTEMDSGKLDEELRRMSEIVDHLRPGGTVLFNESFASTNERAGSELARNVISALLASGIDVMFVTHLLDFSGKAGGEYGETAHLLRAERTLDGTRTFRLVPGEPLSTSYGPDLYARIVAAPKT